MNNKNEKNYVETIKYLNNIKEILVNNNEKESLNYAKWTEEKARLKFQKKEVNFQITNNYIYWCNLGINIGSEQNKIRLLLYLKQKNRLQYVQLFH